MTTWGHDTTSTPKGVVGGAVARADTGSTFSTPLLSARDTRGDRGDPPRKGNFMSDVEMGRGHQALEDIEARISTPLDRVGLRVA
jgi:hypothetical protein